MKLKPTCLSFFVDESGHEDFADKRYPIFAFGGCAVQMGRIAEVVDEPWSDVKRKHFGDRYVQLHAADSRLWSPAQIQGIAAYFRDAKFARFAVTISSSSLLPVGVSPYQLVVGALLKRWERIAAKCHPLPDQVALIFEASQRGDALVEQFFGGTSIQISGKKIPVKKGLMPKSASNAALEVADFIVNAAGGQSRHWHDGRQGFRADFEAVFHTKSAPCEFVDISKADIN